MKVQFSPKLSARDEERSKAAGSEQPEEESPEAKREGKLPPNRLNAVRSSLAIGRSKQLVRASKERIQKAKRRSKTPINKKAS